MNQGKYVFAQILSFLPKRTFDGIVNKYGGNKYIRHFTCWNQLLCMLFGQLTNRESLRDLVVTLEAHHKKSYHLGIGKKVTRSNLAKANQKRDYRIFEEFAYHLIAITKVKFSDQNFDTEHQKIYAFDSSTIDLCLNVFWWAKFRKAKGGIKLHTLFDVQTQIPSFVHITPANTHDVKAMDELVYEVGAFYVFDRGYLDFGRLFKITNCEAYFVIRAKMNMKFNRIYSAKVDKTKGVLCDQTGKLSGFYTSKNYPDKLRRIKYYDSENKRTFVFLTNNIEATAEDIALLYKKRWQIELFFKWMKQHLKIKSFWGISENAVRIQIYTAISTYCLVAIVAQELKINRSTYEILQILGISLLDKTPLNELFKNIDYNNVNELEYKQLSINLF
ncbi:IS4 family transposase [Flavivirga jejuensis]|uniref:IS4 family transposase n=1 Tax=Flavivirga jejuensis TaxID=870487 RepID=A0ABT8WV41_9FLAO|nr:IS4 family transposase [Flavivirga jejuensis]MDO5977060.1 IS4 family transposase [Flavivirga jejuensis]